MRGRIWLWAAVLSIGCGGGNPGVLDGGGMDGGGGADGATADGATTDSGPNVDGAVGDAGPGADGGEGDAGPQPVLCTLNSECAATEFCAAATCDADGVCTARPTGCPDVDDPVCGCDGMTYGNACEAAMAGVNIAMRGACPTTGCALTPRGSCCFEDGECGSRSMRCVGEMCVAGGEGTCVTNLLRAGQCWEDTDCATGETCESERICPCGAACLLPDAPGQCTPPTTTPCTDNSMCTSAGQYCAKAAGDCAGNGACTVRPRVCPLVIDPVCGCDGMTYNNACLAAVAGVNVASRGACVTTCALRPAAGCCFDDGDCSARNTHCVNEICRRGGEGTCVTNVAADGQCWEDTDCTGRQFCQGARICPCGAACLLPDAPGMCVSIGIAP